MVGSRAEEWLEMSYNNCEVILLPYKHRFSRLYVEFVHKQGHLGTAATTSKTRSRFWITNLQKLAKSVKYNCVVCKKLEKRPMQQVMGSLPEETLKPSPPWYCTGVDLFGPFITRGGAEESPRESVRRPVQLHDHQGCTRGRIWYLQYGWIHESPEEVHCTPWLPSKAVLGRGVPTRCCQQTTRNHLKGLELGWVRGFWWKVERWKVKGGSGVQEPELGSCQGLYSGSTACSTARLYLARRRQAQGLIY